MSAADLQSLLRFLSQGAKVPLATAIGKARDLQSANLGSTDAIAKAKIDAVQAIFIDEKLSKQVLSAAKRVSKKRAAGEDAPSPKKKRKDESLFTIKTEQSPTELESSLALPSPDVSEEELSKVVLFTNRAPLVLAFAVILLRYTMPEQPLSSRLSLAQAYVSVTSRARAVNLGIESGESAEEQGFGEGQPLVTIMGKDLRVLRRWGYEWRDGDADINVNPELSTQDTIKAESPSPEEEQETEEKPALWGLDLEAFKKSTSPAPTMAKAQSASTTNMPIYTPQSARAYLLKSFDTAPAGDAAKKSSAASKIAEKERNLGMLLQTIELLFKSWLEIISPEELDKRIWGWYVKVRPDVEHGVAGWGGKNELKLANILALRREQ